MNRLTALAFATLLLGGCRTNPIERLVNPVPDGAVPQSSGVYVLYDEELKTGGGVSFIPGGENQSINFADRSGAHSGANDVRYAWNGQDVFNDQLIPPAFQHLFAGFSLIVPVDGADVPTATPKDLSGNGYTKLTMWVRGTLTQNNTLRIEGPDDGSGGNTPDRVEISADSLSAGWQQVTLPITAANFSSVRIYLTVSVQYAQPPRTTQAGEGAVLFFDDIRFER